jgi:hypothetical protein
VLPSSNKDDREALEPLLHELWGLGRERHDDTVMALWIAEVQLRKSAFVHRISFGDGDEMAMAAEERKAPADLLEEYEDMDRLRVYTDRPDEETPKEQRERENKQLASRSWRGLPGYEA